MRRREIGRKGAPRWQKSVAELNNHKVAHLIQCQTFRSDGILFSFSFSLQFFWPSQSNFLFTLLATGGSMPASGGFSAAAAAHSLVALSVHSSRSQLRSKRKSRKTTTVQQVVSQN